MSSASEVIANLVAGLNARDSDALGALTEESLLVNGNQEPKSQFVATVLGLTHMCPDISTSVDALVTNAAGDLGFARCIHRLTLVQSAFGFEARNEPSEFVETLFVKVVNGKLVEINTISELKGFVGIKNLDEEVKKVKNLDVQPAPEETDLRANYQAFVSCLNDRSIQEKEVASQYFCDTIMHNGVDISLDASLVFLKKAAANIENQQFRLKQVIIDEKQQRIATHAIITGTPRQPLHGIDPTGKDVEFSAHVIYQLNGGKIRQIYNLWDMKAYRECLG